MITQHGSCPGTDIIVIGCFLIKIFPYRQFNSMNAPQLCIYLFLTFCNIPLVCGRRYKNGPGLKYHYTHYNHEQETSTTMHHEEPVISHPSTPAPIVRPESPKVPASPPPQRGPGRPKKVPGSGTSPNNYCDFCLGDVYENKSTGYPEELLSCADCGRSGSHSFVQFIPLFDQFSTVIPVQYCGLIFLLYVLFNRPSLLPSVYWQIDRKCQEIQMAVYRMQILHPLWNFR